MKPVNRRRPVLEPLETRSLLSVVGDLASSHRSVALVGQVRGTYRDLTTIPDNPSRIAVGGTGRVSPLGNVAVRGEIDQLGFVPQGNATGTVLLSNSRGSVTLALTGPTQVGFTALPSSFQFRVIGATGHDRGWEGSAGALDLGLGTSSPGFTLTFHR